jgi:hypothetical protein
VKKYCVRKEALEWDTRVRVLEGVGVSMAWVLVEMLNGWTSSPILVTMTMEVIHSSETFILTRATSHNVPKDSILHSYGREILKSYKICTTWT